MIKEYLVRIPGALRRAAIPAFLLLLPWLVYLPSLKGAFVFDDVTGIVENNAVHSLDHVGEMAHFWVPSQVSYRPLRFFSFAVDWVRGNGQPRAFHETNLLLHGLGAVALWLLLLQVLPHRRWAVWICVFWLIHPLQVDAVAYISGRKDLLASLFYFVALNGAVMRSRARQGAQRLAGSAIFLLAAGLSFLAKETALTLPATALALELMLAPDGGFRQRLAGVLRRGRVFYGVVLLLGAGALFYKLIVAPGTKLAFNLLTDPITNLPLALQSYALYLRKTIWPWPLVADLRGLFPHRLGTATGWGPFWNSGGLWVTLIGLGCGGLLLTATRGTRHHKIALGSLALYILTALPVANLIPLNEPAAEHYAHLPLAAILVALAAALAALFERWPQPDKRRTMLGVGLLVAVSAASWHRTRVWTSPATLWTSVVALHDGSDRAWSNLGLVRLDAGNQAGALVAFRRALATGGAPQPRIVANLVQTLRDQGQLKEAVAAGRQGLAAHPDNALLLSLTGSVLLEAGQAAAARTLLDRVDTTPDPDRTTAPGWQRDRGLAHALTGDALGGERLLRLAVSTSPADASALASLGWLLMGQERWAEADTTLAQAVALPGASGVAWRNRAVVLLRLGRPRQAAAALAEAKARGDRVPASLEEAVARAVRPTKPSRP